MDRNPNRRFGQSYAPGFNTAPSVPVPARTPEEVGAVDRDVVLRESAGNRADARRDHTRTWHRTFGFNGPFVQFSPVQDRVQLFSYTVPTNCVLTVERVGIMFDNPLFETLALVTVHPLVNGGLLPEWVEDAGIGSETLLYGGDAFFNPPSIDPIYVQAGGVLVWEVQRLAAAFNAWCAVYGRMIGKLRWTAGGSV